MPPAAGVAAAVQGDRAALKTMVVPAVMQQPQLPMMTAASEVFAKDAIIAWFRGEFAAANAIIDALCSHLTQLEDGTAAAAYESAFAAIHRRRLNWIPILQMQKYFSIADVTVELKKVVEKKRSENDVEMKKAEEVADGGCTAAIDEKEKQKDNNQESSLVSNENGGGEVVDEDFSSEITDTGSQEVQPFSEPVEICSNHEKCEARRAQIKMTKGFVAKEPVKGHMVNVVRGLKLYEDIFTETELSKLNDFVNELRVAGQNGELSGETFILYNQQTKGNKRELIQLGVPIFGHVKEDDTNTFQRNYIEPIPVLLQGVIDHLIQWRLLPDNRKPNSCIINFFDEGEYSQPFLKPPHLEQPLSTLLLSESTMAFGRMLVGDGEGNYRGPLMLSLKEGSLLVMRGNSSDTARHVMCSSPNKRVSITFFKVRAEIESNPSSEMTTSSKGMTLWQPGVPMPNNYGPVNMMPKWGLLRSPMVMLAPIRPVMVNPRKIPRGGTGVFLPWNVGSRKHAKHLPPRAQRGRFLALPPPADGNKPEN
ncbi:RNA demethylase ALKBH10B-like [Salvia miltiorrhiza]|uniref:RNA demethylase ALKBH10B-like n=1 Tax=Salvia miltiorrhiza TaxID=226208 RepID=UPI0025ABB038|nr:RNA demethylase ALKBH10B-like [Salvia miltiorrhiza]